MRNFIYLIFVGLALALHNCGPKSYAKTAADLPANADQLSPALLEAETGLPAATTTIERLESNKDLVVNRVTHNGSTYIVVWNGVGLAMSKE